MCLLISVSIMSFDSLAIFYSFIDAFYIEC